MRKEDYKICIDMNDTIEDLVQAWIIWLNKKYGTSVTYKDITDWQIWQFFPTLTKQQVYDVLIEPEFWKTVQPKYDAIKYIKQLKDDGFDVYICTHSLYKCLKEKMEEVLFKYFPFITWNDVIVMQNKQMLMCDVLIDDGPHNLVDGDYHKILYSTPYNQNTDDYGLYDYQRAHNWEEVYELVNSLFEHDNNMSTLLSDAFLIGRK